jgi:Spy/CpxP family protein refolding chaperone
MKGKFNLKLGLLCVILSALLVAPALGQGTSQPTGKSTEHPAGQPTVQPKEHPAAPATGQPKEHPAGPAKGGPEEQFKQRRIQMIKQLKLSPDKEKAVLAVTDKYDGQRKEIIDNLRKTKADLQAALASGKPDEAKVKELVNSLTSGMDSLFNSFKSQREEELAQMTPTEQGKYLLELNKMREEMMEKGKTKGKKK